LSIRIDIPVSNDEALLVKMIFVHLGTVRRASSEGMVVKIKGLKGDVKDLMSLRIAKIALEGLKPRQDRDFVEFIKQCMRGK